LLARNRHWWSVGLVALGAVAALSLVFPVSRPAGDAAACRSLYDGLAGCDRWNLLVAFVFVVVAGVIAAAQGRLSAASSNK
jgi:hypothetical protein